MRKHTIILTGAVLLAALAAAQARAGDDTLLGTGIGAAVGGLLGSQFGHGGGNVAATTFGIVAGGLVGNGIGQSMENANSAPAYGGSGYYNAYEPTAPIVYQSYAPNYVAPPAPPPTYIDEDAGTYCRPFSELIRVNGRLRESYGTACLQPDGTWRIVQ